MADSAPFVSRVDGMLCPIHATRVSRSVIAGRSGAMELRLGGLTGFEVASESHQIAPRLSEITSSPSEVASLFPEDAASLSEVAEKSSEIAAIHSETASNPAEIAPVRPKS